VVLYSHQPEAFPEEFIERQEWLQVDKLPNNRLVGQFPINLASSMFPTDEALELRVLGDVLGDEGADDVDFEVFVAGAL
jgi:hypothetical protein